MQRNHYMPPYDQTRLTQIIDAVDAIWREGFNSEQRTFALAIDQKLNGLQGPPGTGKTYTVAPGAIARAVSYTSETVFTGMVSAHTHDAVDEVLDDTNDVLETLDAAGKLPVPVRLLRIHPGDIPAGSEQIDGQFIEHFSYNHDRDELVCCQSSIEG